MNIAMQVTKVQFFVKLKSGNSVQHSCSKDFMSEAAGSNLRIGMVMVRYGTVLSQHLTVKINI